MNCQQTVSQAEFDDSDWESDAGPAYSHCGYTFSTEVSTLYLKIRCHSKKVTEKNTPRRLIEILRYYYKVSFFFHAIVATLL